MSNRTCIVCNCNFPGRRALRCDACRQRLKKYGYDTPRPLRGLELFWSKVDKTGECWLWMGPLNQDGYGKFGDGRYHKTEFAHRIAYSEIVGPIPQGLSLDHLCHNDDDSCWGGPGCAHRACVNPSHLEAVPIGINILRGNSPPSLNARRTHCPCGREYDWIRTDGRRGCKTCFAELTAAGYRRRRDQARSA